MTRPKQEKTVRWANEDIIEEFINEKYAIAELNQTDREMQLAISECEAEGGRSACIGEIDVSAQTLSNRRREYTARVRYGKILPSQIILCAIGVLLGLQQLAGQALPGGVSAWQGSPTYPEQGDFFEDGSQGFTDVAALLQQAGVMRGRGAAADAYMSATATLTALAHKLADLDSRMQYLVKDQADCVARTQLGLGIEQDLLIAAYPYIYWLERDLSTFMEAYSKATWLARAAVFAGVCQLLHCYDNSVRRRHRANGIRYDEVAKAARQVIEACQHAAVAGDAPAPATNSVMPPAARSASWVSVAADAGSTVGPQSTQTSELPSHPALSTARFGGRTGGAPLPSDPQAPRRAGLTPPRAGIERTAQQAGTDSTNSDDAAAGTGTPSPTLGANPGIGMAPAVA